MRLFLRRLLPILPVPLQHILRAQHTKIKLRQSANRKKRTLVVVDDILNCLDRCDLDGDFIIHGSISNIGKLDRPVSALVQEWLRRIDLQRQTVICPALPYNSSMWEYLEKTTEFDVRTAGNAMGAISNLVMAMPGSLRSMHPTHSVVALGASASEYVRDHELDSTPFGIHSPYKKLTLAGGKIVMFGVGLNSVTCFHVHEDMLGTNMPVPVYMNRSFEVKCKGYDGKEKGVSTACHNPAISAVRECERARGALVRAGAIKTYSLGESGAFSRRCETFYHYLVENAERRKFNLRGDQAYGHTA